MESNAITWKIVPNTVANRMKNLSLIHKLMPIRKIRRRSKVMNIAIKRSRGVKTYSQYAKMKTSILRNMFDNSETDEDDVFTEDDYSIFYKSDKSLTKQKSYMSKESKCYCEVGFESDENDNVLSIKNEKTLKDSRSKSSKNTSLGCQRIAKVSCETDHTLTTRKIKHKSNSIDYFNIVSPEMDKDMDLSLQANNDNCLQKSNSNSENRQLINTEACVPEESIDLCVKTSVNYDKVIHNTSAFQEVTNSSNELDKSISRFNEISKNFPLDENQSTKVQAQTEEEKKNLPCSSSNADEIHNEHDSFANIKMNSDENHFLHVDKDSNVLERCTSEFTENKRSFKIDSLVIANMYQPKDSGIEEDTEEEFPEHVRTDCENTQQDVSDKLNSKDTTLFCKYGSTSNVEEHKEEKVDKYKLQPKVTRTEIVNKKYKIILCNTYSSNVCTNLEESSMKNSSYERVHETEEGEDNISILTKTRLEKLRKLNLTTDSDSSSSENEDALCNVENMMEKLFKRSEESSDVSDDKDENVHFNLEISFESDKSLENSKDWKKESLLCEESDKKEPKIDNRSRKKGSYHLDNDDILKRYTKVKKDSLSHIKESSDASNKIVQEKCRSFVCTTPNFDQKKDSKRLNENHQKIKNTKQPVNKEAAMCHRPCNLQEFVDEESLELETAIPSFKFNNIEEDDELVVLDIPSAVFQSQLIGEKMILTEKTLKVGKRKYKVKYRNVDNISCVFATGKSHKRYKIVNIQPMARIVAREKIMRKSLVKSSNLL